MDFSTLGRIVQSPKLFYGPSEKPFLAPRGVHTVQGKLLVSDTGQNRVFIWNKPPTATHQKPDVILGQTQLQDAGRNADTTVSASTLHYPSGVWSDGQRVIVADAWNHRVLIWNQMPTTNGQKADVVLGQPDFTNNQPNVEGISAHPTARTLHWPYGVFSDGQHLWIADTGNRRVLFYKTIPTDSYAAADDVIGKPDFTTRDFLPDDPIWPYSVKISQQGALAIADTQFYRTLVWKDKDTAFRQKADCIIGQANFQDSGQNQFRLNPEAHTLNWTYDCCFYKNGLLVNDTGNSRILYFKNLPEANNPAADAVIGRPDFVTGSEFKGNLEGTHTALYWPFSVTVDGATIVIADTGNHRILLGTLDA